MSVLLWLVVLCPFLGAMILAIFGAYMPKKLAGALACVMIGASSIFALMSAGGFHQGGYQAEDAPLYTWMLINGLHVQMSLHIDALSLLMMLVVTFVAFLIHLYAAQSMYKEDGYSRFFCYMNLFVGSMLVLVLGSNLLTLYLGWEGVGLCSFLLISFWYKDIKNVHAGQKAFIVTRIGDTAFAVGLFILFWQLGTLDIQAILSGASRMSPATITLVAFLLIGGAIGKSAQVPLQTWLPDAMAGPTPVSALIHAATMVTAGVYLLARMHTIISMSHSAQLAVGVIGMVTLLYSGFSALTQKDIKRVLAYSTISQIGYMFLALGVGAWTGAMFHFMTHAFFKSLLFLSAGIVIDAMHHEHDIFKMGGLRKKLPVAFWTFLIGAAALSALPLVTSGFYSKDAILWDAWASGLGNTWFLIGGLLGSLITAAYAFRVVFLVFYGEAKTEVTKQPGMLEQVVVTVLSFFAIVAGFVSLPKIFRGFDPFGRLMSTALPALHESAVRATPRAEDDIILISVVLSLFGIYLAYVYFKSRNWSEALGRSAIWRGLHTFLFAGWMFDKLYDRVLVKPFKAIAYANAGDFVDDFFKGLAGAARYANLGLSRTQTGRLRNCTAGLLFGAILLAAIMLWSTSR